MENISIYDHTELYETKIAPKFAELQQLCIDNDIPFFATFAITNDDKSTEYKSISLMPGTLKGLKLTDDKLKNMLQILSGYTKPSDIMFDTEEDDFPTEV